MTSSASLVAAALLAAAPLAAQSLARDIEGVRTGTVRFSFASDPGTCGWGEGNVSRRDRGSIRSREWERECEEGPVRVALDVRDGRPTAMRMYVGGRWRGSADRDLGTVGVREASRYLLDLARTEPRIKGDPIVPAIFADSVEVWPELLRIARDGDASRDVRKRAVFWVSQEAGKAAADGLGDMVEDDSEDREVREQAVFALSQLPREEGIPRLIRVARTSREPSIRKKAIFWLGQSEDPRALALFEELLVRDR